jgi:hypothetical protein
MVATTLPAVVRVVDLPVGTTVTGSELIEAVQTTSGVGVSVQLPLSQIATSLGIPTGGATGTILNKSSGSNFSTQFSAINTFVNVGTSLATTGSATSIVAFVANQGITSTQIANNAVGTNQVASSLGIASSLSIGTLLTVGGTATITGTTILNGGLQVTGTTLLTGVTGVIGTTLVTGTFGQVGTSLMTGAFGVVGTSIFTGSHGVVGTTLFTSGAFGVVGTSTFTGTLNVVGTSVLGTASGNSLTLSLGAAASAGNLTVVWPNTGAPTTTGTVDTSVAVRFNVQGAVYDIGVYPSGTIWTQARNPNNLATTFSISMNPYGGGVAVGTAGLTGNSVFGVQGTTLVTGTLGVVGTATFTGVHNVIGTTIITGALALGNLVTGFLSTNGTGVVTATTIVALATATSTALGADVNLTNLTTYFDGPSIAQGNGTGVWFVTGNVTVTDPTNAQVYVKLWDGATVIASIDNTVSAGFIVGLTLSGFITSPAGNLRLSCRDISNTSGKILFNTTGNSKDSNITAIRIG